MNSLQSCSMSPPVCLIHNFAWRIHSLPNICRVFLTVAATSVYAIPENTSEQFTQSVHTVINEIKSLTTRTLVCSSGKPFVIIVLFALVGIYFKNFCIDLFLAFVPLRRQPWIWNITTALTSCCIVIEGATYACGFVVGCLVVNVTKGTLKGSIWYYHLKKVNRSKMTCSDFSWLWWPWNNLGV